MEYEISPHPHAFRRFAARLIDWYAHLILSFIIYIMGVMICKKLDIGILDILTTISLYSIILIKWGNLGMLLCKLAEILICVTYFVIFFLLIITLYGVLYNIFFYKFFGNTIGKKLLGIKVVNSDLTPISLKTNFKREIRILFYGYGACIPIISFFTLIWCFHRVVNKGKTIWDEKANLIVLYRKQPPLNTFLKFLTSVIVFILIFFLLGTYEDVLDKYLDLPSRIK